jgi:hypothetical protein
MLRDRHYRDLKQLLSDISREIHRKAWRRLLWDSRRVRRLKEEMQLRLV